MLRAFKNYFAITKKEWNGMVVLMLIIVLVLISPMLLQYFHKDKQMDLADFKKAVAQLKSAKGGEPDYINTNDDKTYISGGLKEGDLIIGSNTILLYDALNS